PGCRAAPAPRPAGCRRRRPGVRSQNYFSAKGPGMTTAVVSGGGTGIGLAVARRLAARGLDVTVLGRRPDVLADAAKQAGATPVVCDVTDPAAVLAVLDALPAEVDVLVNNAGGNTDLAAPAPPPGDLGALAAAWQDNLRSNLISA